MRLVEGFKIREWKRLQLLLKLVLRCHRIYSYSHKLSHSGQVIRISHWVLIFFCPCPCYVGTEGKCPKRSTCAQEWSASSGFDSPKKELPIFICHVKH